MLCCVVCGVRNFYGVVFCIIFKCCMHAVYEMLYYVLRCYMNMIS